jgi:hypothetical protein
MMRRPLDEGELAALREPLDRGGPDAFRALLVLLDFPLDLLPELRDRLLELPFPPLALIPPLIRVGMLVLG